MKILRPFAFVLLLTLFLSSCQKDQDPIVVMLSLDGFRWDYAAKTETPSIDRLAAKGVRARSLQPAYPSKTFPNHYSMATGLYPDHHGIVQNNFFDPELDRAFRIGNRDAVQDSVFWGGEPIWETAEKQGVKTASFFWVGTESNARFQPSNRKIYEQSVPFENRIDSVISWLYLPVKDRPDLIMFYYHEPDGVGHTYGPDHQETVDMIAQLDAYIGMFLDKLEMAEEDNDLAVNFILTSDHGMGGIPGENYVILSDILDIDRLERIHGGNPVYLISPFDDYYEEALTLLQQTDHLKVFEKDALPAHYHYGTHARIESIVVEADSAWGISLRSKQQGYSAGTHGYDPANTDMHGIFYAIGPAFKSGYLHPTFENVSLYSLIAKILNLEPTQTDGSLEEVVGLLKSNK